MFHKPQEVYGPDTKHVKYCFGVSSLPLLKFNDPKIAFTIAAVHSHLGLRERFVDRLTRKLLGDVNSENLNWNESSLLSVLRNNTMEVLLLEKSKCSYS